MALNIGQMRQILQLESSKDYADLAVMGGLDRYLRRLEQFHLPNPSYAAMNREQRREWVNSLLQRLDEVEKAGERKHSTSPGDRAPSGDLDSPVTFMKGVSLALAAKFARLGVHTMRDMLYFFPRRHLDYSRRKSISRLEGDEEQTIIANVWQAQEIILGGRRGTEAIVGDETGNIRVIWFNQPYLARKLRPNTQVVISGKVSLFRGRMVFESPEWELMEDKELIHTGRLVPLYPLTQGLHPRQMRGLMKRVMDQWAWRVTDFMPEGVRAHCHLLELPQSILQAHYPDNELLKDRARERLAFDELFLIQLGVLARKRNWQESQPGNPFKINGQVTEKFLHSLPFTLTGSQKRVLGEILADLEKPKPMSRLLQGEVGSGKTVVAAAALLAAIGSGYQGALMAPTEILAEQHFSSICQLLSGGEREGYLCSCLGLLSRPINVSLLIGDIPPKEKERLQSQIREGKVDLVIGTHAIIQRGVEFQRLGLAVVDEQHRFGVLQRSALRQKGFNPHVLVMTATPIPRTLALTLYGDLDLSVIDELPPGRLCIKTKWLSPEQREGAYNFLRREIKIGRQAFIICPLIEESESIATKAAIAEYQRLSEGVFPDLRLGLLHGRMPASEKEDVMRRFRAGEVDILVSTPVVEVGIDVPNATLMLVEGADRFGLSQLHQFRGRVGRGKEQSYCLLLAEFPSEEGRERLALIEQIQDGFVLAEEDLRLRGPGEFFGTRQSGLPDLRMARLSDVALLERAREEAIRLFQEDPGLEAAEHRLLSQEIARVWQNGGEWS